MSINRSQCPNHLTVLPPLAESGGRCGDSMDGKTASYGAFLTPTLWLHLDFNVMIAEKLPVIFLKKKRHPNLMIFMDRIWSVALVHESRACWWKHSWLPTNQTDRPTQPPHQTVVQFKADLICCTVVLIKLLTVFMDSTLIFADGKLLTRIWNATVTNDPPDPPPPGTILPVFELVEAPPPPVPLEDLQSGSMLKPEGRRGM